ncbi:MFS transporter [Sciscionella sediminilitoris]|uniref:MFS transporter n=1 Tax=Sciscionella sediminilitoris TaxID=1445613 RepID=UPI00068C1731|nr:MFS transporter [Sciscionella sp. SE31]
MGLAFGIFSFVQIITLPAAGWIVDRFGVRLTFFFAAVSWAAITVATALVRGFVSLVTLRFILGAGEAPMAPCANKAVAEWFPKRERAFAIGSYQVGSDFGVVITMPIVSGLIAFMGWRISFVVTGLIGLVWAFVWLRFYRSPRNHPKLSEQELAYIESGGSRSSENEHEVHGGRIRWIDLFRYRTIWGLIGVMYCRASVIYFFITWFPSYLVDELGFSLLEVGIYGVIPGLMAAGASMAGGALSDWMIRRGTDPSWARKLPMAIGLLLGAAIVPVGFSDNAVVAVLLLGVSSAGVSLAAGPLYAMMIEVTPGAGNVASTTSLLVSASAVGVAVGPVLVGFILGATGSYVIPLLLAGGFTILGIVFLFTLVGKNEALPVKGKTVAAR